MAGAELLAPIAGGLILGVLARIALLQVDYRMYPSYPHGWLIHFAWGVIAAFVGSVVVPALVAEEFTAATFLVLVAQQFRDIRRMERASLDLVESMELVPRGPHYIEGIARTFEARSYLVIAVSLVTSTIITFTGHILAGVAGGVVTFLLVFMVKRGQRVGDIAKLKAVDVEFEGTLLKVANVIVMEVGLKKSREWWLNRGTGVIIEPKDDDARATLASLGQRQAIAHDTAAIMGVTKDFGLPEFTPLVRRDIETGRVVMAIVPMEPDRRQILAAVERVPVLEAVRRAPLQSEPGLKAAD